MEELNLLLAQIHCAAKEVGAQKIELRSTKMQNECATSSLCASASYKHHYLSLDKTADELFATFAKSSVRQKVNKAKRAGVIIEERDDEEGLRICHAILESTRRRLALPPIPYAFFQAMRRRLGTDHLNVYIAMHAGQAVATHLVLPFRDLWISEYTGNTNSAPHGVNQLLWWDTIQRAQASDARWFSFGRTSSDNEGLLAYKRRWAPIEEDVVHFTNKAPNASLTNARVIKLPDFSTLYGITKLLLRKAPTPVCRMIGNFCYRHLG